MNKTDLSSSNTMLICLYKTGEKRARGELINNNLNLVTSIAQRFKDRGHDMEDLIEVGKIGLIKAIDGFDDTLGYSFSTYAFPLIMGEIRRFIRDDGMIKVNREIKRNASSVLNAKQEYIKYNGKEPRISELSKLCKLSCEKIVEALTASSPIISLQEKVGNNRDTEFCETIPDEDKIDSITEKIALRQAISTLNNFDKKLISLRFFRELTQENTAKLLGISQVSVSRHEKRIIENLRKEMLI